MVILSVVTLKFPVLVTKTFFFFLSRESFISVYRLQSIMKGSQYRDLEQELKQRPQRNIACWLVLCGSPGLLSYIVEDHLPSVLNHHIFTIN